MLLVTNIKPVTVLCNNHPSWSTWPSRASCSSCSSWSWSGHGSALSDATIIHWSLVISETEWRANWLQWSHIAVVVISIFILFQFKSWQLVCINHSRFIELVCLKEVDNIWKRFEKKIELVENAWKLAVSLHQRPQALHRAVICPEIMENTASPPTSTHSLLSSTSSTSPTSTPTPITTEMIVNTFPQPTLTASLLSWYALHGMQLKAQINRCLVGCYVKMHIAACYQQGSLLIVALKSFWKRGAGFIRFLSNW